MDDPHTPADDTAPPELPRDPADVDGLGLEELWRLCESPVALRDPLIGVAFAGVRLAEVVGEGGMGRVYRADRIGGSGSVAVKVLRPGVWSREMVRRFAKESTILRRLDHPGISRIEHVGTCDVLGIAVPAIVMEFVPDARPIDRFVRERGLDTDAIVALFARVCDAVAHGHAAGVIHRDIKPGNILVDAAGNPKVIDFGVARTRDGGDLASSLTTPSALVGTLQYMSPEQVVGGGARVDARSDVHALASVLHELVDGQPPFTVAGLPVVEAVRMIAETPPRCGARVPRRLAAVLARCLEKDPARRYRDAGALAAALRGNTSWGSAPPLAGWRRFPFPRASAARLGRSRRAEVIRGALAGLLAGAVLLAAVQAVRDWSAIDRLSERIAALAGSVMASVRGEDSLVFQHGFRTVEQFDADRWLVQATAMRKWIEDWSQERSSYWGPSEEGVPGTLVYRFEFSRPANRIEVRTHLSCWNFEQIPETDGERRTGYGRGASAVDVSRDGVEWHALFDDIADGSWGKHRYLDGDLPDAVTGGNQLWLRIRLLAESLDPEGTYTVAQFARSSHHNASDIFAIRAFARRPGSRHDTP